MFLKSREALKLATAGAIAASFLGAGSAQAATQNLAYTCQYPLIGAQPLQITINATIPTSVQAGQATGAFAINAVATAGGDTGAAIGLLGARSLEGSASADAAITVNGVAKAFAMTGWRIGYIGAPEFIAKACTKMQGQVTSGANSIAQRATIAAVDADPSVLKDMVEAFHRRRDLVVKLVQDIPGMKVNVPEGAFYVFPDVSSYFGSTLRGKTINDANDLAMYLLSEAGVATVTGDAFGNPDCIRISYATSEDLLEKALGRIKDALAG